MDQPITLDTVVGFLVSTPLFDGLDAAERAEVVRIMEVKRLQGGEEIFHEGTAGDAWYVIFEGQVKVVKDAATGPTQIAILGPGSCFGEMAILDGQPRSASVEAAGPLTIFKFRRVRFDELLHQGSLGAYKLVAGMARSLSQRHRQLTQQVSELMAGKATKSERATMAKAVEAFQLSE
jgi:CRP-like cAMP-binding protein